MRDPQDPAAPVVDPSVLATLAGRLGDRGPAFRASLVQTWRDETTARLLDLDKAAAGGDRDGVARVAHTLKSSAAALGAQALSTLCERLELSLRAREECDLDGAAAELHAAVRAADDAFSALGDGPPQLSAGSGG